MAATRENVLAAIVEYVEENKRRAPASAIALKVADTVPNVQAIVKTLVTEGAINSSRGRNGGALPDGVVLEKKAKASKPKVEVAGATPEPAQDNTPSDEADASELAALLATLEAAPADEAPAPDLFAEA